ncbi:recombinase family protein [Planctomycetota bacterium]
MTGRRRRAAIYSRVSTRKEEQARALEGHEARVRRYAEDREFHLDESHVYLDQASGTTDRRPRYRRLRAAARAREIDVIITTRLDRLARSVKELVTFVSELSDLGVDLIVLDQQLDTTTAAGRLMFHVLGAVAQFEAELARERVIRGLERARERGKKLGRPSPSVDLDEVRRLQAEGLSLRQIAKKVPGRLRGSTVSVSPTLLSRRLRDPSHKARGEFRDGMEGEG